MKRLTLFVVCAAVLMGVGALPASASNAPSFDLQALERTAQTDLAAAQADADAHSDTVASQCYAGVSAYVSAHPLSASSLGSVQGVASAFQVARDGVKTIEGAQASAGIPMELEIACGPLALDVQSDLGKATARLTILGLHF